MSSQQGMAQDQAKKQGSKGAVPLRELRRAAGFRTGREVAAALGVPATSYSRWERSPQGPGSTIPLRQAWALADLLGCTIDAVVGRDGRCDDDGDGHVGAAYRALSDGGRERLDEYLQFLALRDRMIASSGR